MMSKKRRVKNQIINLISEEQQTPDQELIHNQIKEQKIKIIIVKEQQDEQKKIILNEQQNESQLQYEDYCPNLQISLKKYAQVVRTNNQQKKINKYLKKGAMIQEQEESYEIPKLSKVPQNQNDFLNEVINPFDFKNEQIHNPSIEKVQKDQQKINSPIPLEGFQSIIDRSMMQRKKARQQKIINNKFKQEEEQQCRYIRQYKDISKLSKKKHIKKEEIKKIGFKVQVKQSKKQLEEKQIMEKNTLFKKQRQRQKQKLRLQLERKLKQQKQIQELKEIIRQKHQKQLKQERQNQKQKELNQIKQLNLLKEQQKKQIKPLLHLPFYIKMKPIPFPFKAKKIISTKLVKKHLKKQDSKQSNEQEQKKKRIKSIVYVTELLSGQIKQFTHQQMVNLNKDVIFNYFQEKIAWNGPQIKAE